MSSPENGSNSQHASPIGAIETIVNRSLDKPLTPAEDAGEIERIVAQERSLTISSPVHPMESFEDTDQTSHKHDWKEHINNQPSMGD